MSRGSYQTTRGKYRRSRNERRIDSHVKDPAARLVNAYVPKRGTIEWDERELLRKHLGCMCLSFGPLP